MEHGLVPLISYLTVPAVRSTTGSRNRKHLKALNDTKLVLNVNE